MIREKTKKLHTVHILSGIFLLGGSLLFFLTVWFLNRYDQISLDQIIYQMKTTASGTGRDVASSAFLEVGGYGFGAAALAFLAYCFLAGHLPKRLAGRPFYGRYCQTKVCAAFRRGALPLSLAVLTAALVFFLVKLDVVGYLATSATESDFIEEHYVDPNTPELVFPQKKRNLVYIYLESMENTFADPLAGGLITDNYIPELAELAEENINFSHTDGLGGAYSYTGTTWTAAAMVAQTSGLVVKVPLTADNYGGEDAYLPGVVSLGEILEKEGYQQVLLLGSDAGFAGRDSYFSGHGNYEIVDINALKEQGRLPEEYYEWWGYEDEKLFAFAKEELTRLAETGEPFNFTMLTADTHFPDGYTCRLCRSEYEEQYPNVLRCSARQVAGFVEWLRSQPFYENTTIILSGDHLTMDPGLVEDVEESYERTVYNCIINAPIEPAREKNRQFGTFDMLPTTLAAMGVAIEGEQLGLGVNLFSGQPTLTEQYGYARLDAELQKSSLFYNAQFLEMTGDMDAWLEERGCAIG